MWSTSTNTLYVELTDMFCCATIMQTLTLVHKIFANNLVFLYILLIYANIINTEADRNHWLCVLYFF